MSIELARSKRRPLAPFLLVLLSACSSPPPVLPGLAESRERIPVVLVPGVTGVTLRERDSGKTVWGRGVNLIRPHDGGYELALPIASGAVGPTKLEPGKVIEEVRLAGVFRKSVYRPIVELLEANGYRRGDLSDPDPADDLFLYAYDWRQDNILSARRLAELLERVRRARSDARLPVALLCQSNGAHVCRWLVKFGKAGLEQAEAGIVEKPEGVDVVKVILVATSSGGGLRVLREMDRGRSYVRPMGRNWRPEVMFTYPSFYQDLPGYRRDLSAGRYSAARPGSDWSADGAPISLATQELGPASCSERSWKRCASSGCWGRTCPASARFGTTWCRTSIEPPRHGQS
jgi:hypothetical protein